MVSNVDILNQVVASKGVDPVMADFLRHTMSAESGCNNNARSSSSSACGLFQFLDGTWETMVRRHPNELTAGGRSDPRQQCIAGVYYAQENAASLRSHNHEVTAGNLYLCHFLGSGGANTVLSADPNAPISRYVGAAGMRSNASIVLHYTGADGRDHVKHFADFTVGDLRAWSDKKMGGRIHYNLLDSGFRAEAGLSDNGEEPEATPGTHRTGGFNAEGNLTFTTIIVSILGILLGAFLGHHEQTSATPSVPVAPATPAVVAPQAAPSPAQPAVPTPTSNTPSGDQAALSATTRFAVLDTAAHNGPGRTPAVPVAPSRALAVTALA